MKITILGAASFIGTNLTLALKKEEAIEIKAIDQDRTFFSADIDKDLIVIDPLNADSDYDALLKDQDIVFHLLSSSAPSNSNQDIAKELTYNIDLSCKILEACVRQSVKRIIFVSSGGACYGNKACPIREDASLDPISAYGTQKVAIEKLLYLYDYLYGLDHRIIRLANPFGPHQRPNGRSGVITNFIAKALKGEEIVVFGDGRIVRDYIYIDDAVRMIKNIALTDLKDKIFNVASGKGEDILTIIKILEAYFGDLRVSFRERRKADVSVNYLDTSLYHSYFDDECLSLKEGIEKTIDYFKLHL